MKGISLIKWIVGGIIAIAIATYIIVFWDQSISQNTSMWGAFSDYLNPFVAISNLVVFIWLSIQVYKYNESRDKEIVEFQKSIEKPILIFMSMPSNNLVIGETWKVKNIGNGAALNLRVAESHTREIFWKTPVTKCYSLAKNDELALTWLTSANVICVTYQDIFGNNYVTIGADDESISQPINSDTSIIIDGTEFNEKDFTDFLNNPTKRLRQAIAESQLHTSVTSQTTNPS